jgi:hypothetical protein
MTLKKAASSEVLANFTSTMDVTLVEKKYKN